MKFEVWYMKPEHFRDYGGVGGKKPDPKNLGATHTYLMDFEADHVEGVWVGMQGENWSPNGEAKELLDLRGLRHTSMSVGDVAVAENGDVLLVASFGFKNLSKMERA